MKLKATAPWLLGTALLVGCGQSEQPASEHPADPAAEEHPAEPAARAQPQNMETADEAPEGTEATTQTPPELNATVIGSDGSEIGSLIVHPLRQGVRLDLHVEGLEPGEHAVHIHETGICTPPDFTSAGGHYDPAGARHGMPDADEDMSDPDHHAGDMLNQTVDDNGMLDAQVVNQSVTIADENPLLDHDGSALVIHAGPDDYESQPAGAAGPRVACAAITKRD